MNVPSHSQVVIADQLCHTPAVTAGVSSSAQELLGLT
jgi:hypothetical protein